MLKKPQVAGHGKCLKLAGPHSQKNATNSQVHGHKKIPKTRKSALTKKMKKLAAP